jgi:hypothetical protein
MYSLSSEISAPVVLSWKSTTPSPGWRGSLTTQLPAGTQRPSGVVCALLPPTRGRDHVKPPFVDRDTNTPFAFRPAWKPSWA